MQLAAQVGLAASFTGPLVFAHEVVLQVIEFLIECAEAFLHVVLIGLLLDLGGVAPGRLNRAIGFGVNVEHPEHACEQQGQDGTKSSQALE